MSKANCKWCAGTGIDPDFMDACKCTMEVEVEVEVQDPEGPSKSQVSFLEKLYTDFSVLREKFIPDTTMVWVTSTPTATSKGMSKKIDLLKSLITLVRWIVAKRESIPAADLAMILAKIEKPTTSEWITKTINRVNGVIVPKKGEKVMGHPLKDLIQKKMRTELPWLSAALIQDRKEATTILVAINGLLTEMKANREAMTPEFIEQVRTLLNDKTTPKMRSINTLKIEMHKILS